jgi:membrane-bound acyltransferase YfiQ involved in biofilm formation
MHPQQQRYDFLYAMLVVVCLVVFVQFVALAVFASENQNLKSMVREFSARDRAISGQAIRLLDELKRQGWDPKQ